MAGSPEGCKPHKKKADSSQWTYHKGITHCENNPQKSLQMSLLQKISPYTF